MSGGNVERFFRTMKSELDVRPIRHRLADRVRAHVFLRMLSYYLGWHMKQALAPILFHDDDKPAARANRAHPVATVERSDRALAKAARKRTADDQPVHSFISLLADLATICTNRVQPADDMRPFTMITTPTPLQRRALELLGAPPTASATRSHNAKPAGPRNPWSTRQRISGHGELRARSPAEALLAAVVDANLVTQKLKTSRREQLDAGLLARFETWLDRVSSISRHFIDAGIEAQQARCGTSTSTPWLGVSGRCLRRWAVVTIRGRPRGMHSLRRLRGRLLVERPGIGRSGRWARSGLRCQRCGAQAPRFLSVPEIEEFSADVD